MSSLLKKEGYIDFPLCCGRIYMNDGPLFVFKTTEESIILEFYIIELVVGAITYSHINKDLKTLKFSIDLESRFTVFDRLIVRICQKMSPVWSPA
jgi:hypothetical protein